jgi:hypothetical protein
MKNRLLLLISLLIIIAACNKTDIKQTSVPGCTNPNSLTYNPDATVDDGSCLVPDNVKYGFVLEFTETACHFCGEWGVDTMHGLCARPNVVGVACHSSTLGTSDPMLIPEVFDTFAVYRPNGGVPDFYIGDQEITTTNGFTPALTNLMKDPPVAGVTFQATRGATTMTVKTLTEFFQPAIGDYHLAVYVCESGIDGSNSSGAYRQQTSLYSATYKHSFAIRAVYNNKAFGERMASGAIAAGTFVQGNYVIPISASWTNDVYVVCVLWERTSLAPKDTYTYINSKQFGTHLAPYK